MPAPRLRRMRDGDMDTTREPPGRAVATVMRSSGREAGTMVADPLLKGAARQMMGVARRADGDGTVDLSRQSPPCDMSGCASKCDARSTAKFSHLWVSRCPRGGLVAGSVLCVRRGCGG